LARAVAWLIHLSGRPTALACQDGLFLGTRRIGHAGRQFWDASHRLLMNREAQAAVFENSAALILDDGLPYDRCHVGVVTDFDGHAALAHHNISDADQLYKVLRTQIDVVLGDGVGVLNADDARIAEMASLCDGEVLMYARSTDAGMPAALNAHLAAGGRACVLRQGRAILMTGPTERLGPDLAALLARDGLASDGVHQEALLAAVATAWAFGISPELIAAGIETFKIHAPA
jgi:cyanophycin synthetase